jgi:selenide, water dikinase
MTSFPSSDLVLLGIGHTNAHVLRMWRMHPIPGVRLTCVSNFPVATYSGMLPGVLGGLYPPERMEIDLVRLCASAGARLIVDEVTGLDAEARQLRFADRASLAFDVLVIGIGSVPTFDGVTVADASRLVTIKPMQTFLTRLEEAIDRALRSSTSPLRLAVAGGGAGGVEVAFGLPARVEAVAGSDARGDEVVLYTGDARLLPGSVGATARRIALALARRNIRLETGRAVTRVDGRCLTFIDGSHAEADVIVWATGAAPPPLVAALGLPTDARGFLRTADTLQTPTGAPIFVVGDTASIDGAPMPKAGVYAVRQGPVLRDNIERLLGRRSLRRYRPQRGFLKLLNTGDGRAIGEWKGVAFEGRWVWRLKDAIDGPFMDRYQDYTPAVMTKAPAPKAALATMRCLGCGGKVGAGVLSRALARLDIPSSPHVVVGLDAPDDAAVVMAPAGKPVTVTVDFFAAPFDDPYLVGRLAALNAAGDIFAIGAVPFAALAMVTLPVASARQQEELLYQLLAGSLRELRAMGATLVGGHTIEGPQLTVGFTVLGSQTAEPRTRGRLRAGDLLVSTKALGTGVLLAAHMRALCRASWFTALVRSMLQSNGPAAHGLGRFDVSGLTDVTGFGLGGHLREMLEASGVAARLDARSLPLLPGAAELLQQGVESTLTPANRERTGPLSLGVPPADARVQALFDPQTCGGLLIGVAPDDAGRLVTELHEQGYADACAVGEVVAGEVGIRLDEAAPALATRLT